MNLQVEYILGVEQTHGVYQIYSVGIGRINCVILELIMNRNFYRFITKLNLSNLVIFPNVECKLQLQRTNDLFFLLSASDDITYSIKNVFIREY